MGNALPRCPGPIFLAPTVEAPICAIIGYLDAGNPPRKGGFTTILETPHRRETRLERAIYVLLCRLCALPSH